MKLTASRLKQIIKEEIGMLINEEEEAYYQHKFKARLDDLTKEYTAAGLEAGKSLEGSQQTSVSVISVANEKDNENKRPKSGDLFKAGGPGIDFYQKFIEPKNDYSRKRHNGVVGFLDKASDEALTYYYRGIVKGAKEVGFSFETAKGGYAGGATGSDAAAAAKTLNNIAYGTLTKEADSGR